MGEREREGERRTNLYACKDRERRKEKGEIYMFLFI
jgi:hypothetical protein